jgi:FOG: Ankyrin repeat
MKKFILFFFTFPLGMAILCSCGSAEPNFATLWDAVSVGSLPGVKKLVGKGADVNGDGFHGELKGHLKLNNMTPLMKAAMGGHVEIARELIALGADVNAKTDEGVTAIMIAAFNGHADVVEAIVAAHEIKIKTKPKVEKTEQMTWQAFFATAFKKPDAADSKARAIARAERFATGARDEDCAAALVLAAFNGQTAAVKALVNAGVGINAWTSTSNKSKWPINHKTALAAAAGNGHVETVEELLAIGANANTPNGYENTALVAAVSNKHYEIAKMLVSAGAKTGLIVYNAALKGDLEVVQALIDAEIGDNANDYGDTGLHAAAQNGHLEVAEKFLAMYSNERSRARSYAGNQRAAFVNAKNFSGATALHYASQNGHLQIVKFLLANGANVNAKNDDGFAALQYAVGKVADPIKGDSAAKENTEVAKALIYAGAQINDKNQLGQTALMTAANNGHVKTVQMLLANGAYVNAMDNNSKTALDYAKEIAHNDIVVLLGGSLHEPTFAVLPDDTAASDTLATKERFQPQDNADAYYQKGISQAKAGDYPAAISSFDQALELAPQNASIYKDRGQAHLFNRDYEAALQDAEKAAKLDAKHISTLQKVRAEVRAATKCPHCKGAGNIATIQTLPCASCKGTGKGLHMKGALPPPCQVCRGGGTIRKEQRGKCPQCDGAGSSMQRR